MAKAPELFIPHPYDEMMTDHDHALIEAWQDTSVQDIVDDIASQEEVHLEMANGSTIGYVDLRHPDEEDETEAIAFMLPFAHSVSPAMYIRAAVMQDMLDNKRVLIFPNNTVNKTWYDVDSTHAPAAEAVAHNAVEAAARAGIGKLHVVGGSQGATVGGRMLRYLPRNFDVSDSGAMLAEAPDVVAGRSSKELGKDFKKGGVKTLNTAINDSGIPVLSEVQKVRGGMDSARQLGIFLRYAKDTVLPINKQLREDMTGDFVRSIAAAEKLPARTVIVRMAASLICTQEMDSALSLVNNFFGNSVEVIERYGHEGLDNVVLHALLARKAVISTTKADKPQEPFSFNR
jgi:hypothetical protein